MSVRALVALQLAAFWPVWRWYALRVVDASDEPWGIVALLLAGACYLQLPVVRGAAPGLLLPLCATLAYAIAFPWAPPLLRAGIALAAIAGLLARLRHGAGSLGLIGLLLLSLPVIPSLQFYLGFPLRVVSARLAAGLLTLSGLGVSADGTCLRFAGQLVAIDAPCSGVRMLWGGLLLASTLALRLTLPAARALAVGAGAAGLVVLANGVRAAALFLPETGWLTLPALFQPAIGLVVFAAAACAVVRLAFALAPELEPA